MSEIVAIETNGGLNSPITKRENFTTNPKYMGHTKENIPVYSNQKLEKGTIKMIEKSEFKNLEEGKYPIIITSVYDNLKNNKLVTNIVLELEDKSEFTMTFCLSGFESAKQMEIAGNKLSKTLELFKVNKPADLMEKPGTLVVKKSTDGLYLNYYLYPVKDFIKLPNGIADCRIEGFYEKENKTIFKVIVILAGQEYESWVIYKMDNEWSKKALDKVLNAITGQYVLFDGRYTVPAPIKCKIKIEDKQLKNDPSVIYQLKTLLV